MSDWKEYRLGEVCKMVPGFAFKSNDFGNGNDVAIKIKDIQPPYVETKLADKVDTSKYDLKKLCKFEVHKGEFLLAMTGATIGKIGKYINETPSFVNQRVLKFEDAGIISYDYLYYCLLNNTFQAYILNHIDSQSAQPNISSTTIGKYIIKVPTPNVQKKIASILKSLDDKIEVNRRINENLEQQAQALFKSWFVDFEPFKDGEFVESELGMIPQCLETKYISEMPHVLETGRRPKGGVGELKSGIPSVGAEHVKGMGKYDFSKTKFIPVEYAETLKTGKVNGYELLIYKDGGKPGYFIPNFSIFGEGYPFDKCYLNEHVFKLDFGNRGYNIFCYFYFQTDQVMSYLNAQGGKAAIPGINRQDIENILIFSSENEQVEKFGTLVEPLFTKILINCKESQKLASIRDILLPKLMSGELKVQNMDLISEMLAKGIR